ncbi:MAG TPA: N-formylglutamate amidohydrolase [Nannocystaceae bacterium]|nr:N-formylglutamate amidohydrolase [Nannocystaceae bacterium]
MPELVLTCEHGGNRVPARWRDVLRPAAALLDTHRGYDAGALPLARRLARELDAPLFAATVTRLLVDLNRSADNAAVFSQWTAALPERERAELLARCHAPHREAVRTAIAQRKAVLHVAVHSFTPVLHGERRNADIGLLYDPARPRERAFATRWRALMQPLRVRMNYPYRGTSDGLSRWLRRAFPDRRYAGIELELNQALLDDPARWRAATNVVLTSLRAALS